MKTLGLLRHAKSDWGDARARDFDRPLNGRGERGAPLIGKHIESWCREHDIRWGRILASPAVRAAQTIELAAQGAGYDHAMPVNWDRRIYLASSASLLDVLRDEADHVQSVLMVGHNPGLEDLIFDLVPDDGSSPLRDVVEEKFPTATFAVLEIPVDSWHDVEEATARLVHLMRPRDLDPELGPEKL
ncbi:histidine phosphatase family protein [Novosphingobium umbonatum]|uniref:Histidine phosphatase family protein n=1 Tax=Novosphingobium umbonatum TaxID=1908524 RepID=A0A437N8U9_9SPHN|nr:histidine phosphatase family protein [Novosphingobium umbonatum]RVU06349.1 histidine phosphatase family protein [Novosphingobium umbonatum]